jgi:hypothetical protein
MRNLIGLTALFLTTAFLSAQQIPAGTLLPVMLDGKLESDGTKPSQKISAKLMQEVPLPDGGKIKRESKVTGHVVAVSSASSGHDAKVTVQFDQIDIDKHLVTISVGLRALASMEAISIARQGVNPNSGFGTTGWDLNLLLVGGQAAFTGQQIVKSQTGQVVGKIPEPGAVLAIPMANPARGCPGPAGNTADQAFWLFSTDACGVYGHKDLTVVSGIGGATPGQIALTAPKRFTVEGGSGWLLQVN